jgi:hypothetical protein
MMGAKRALRGSYKQNVDASFQANGSGSAGVILRDCKGEVLGGMYYFLDNLLNTATPEAQGLLKRFGVP